MATSYTTLLGLALPVQGELSGTWGDTVNDYITQYLDASVAGTQTISGSQTAVTLSKTTNASLSQAGSGATGSSQYQIINCTGNPSGLLTVTVPAASKVYLVLNNTSTNQSVKVVGTGPTTGVTVAAARCALIAWNGSDFELVASTDVAALSGVLAVANGGTGASNAGGARTNLGATTLGSNIFTITNPSAITFPRFNADNTVSALSAADFRTAIGAGTGGGSVTSVDVSGGTTGLTTSGGPITSSGTITLAGTLGVANGGTGATTLTGVVIGNGTSAFTVKTNPSGGFVGTTDTQTLTNKTIREMVQVIGANTNAAASTVYVLTASLTLTLPASPTTGDWVTVQNSSGTTTAVIGRNGSNIMSLAEDLTVDKAAASFTLVYADATRGWVIAL